MPGMPIDKMPGDLFCECGGCGWRGWMYHFCLRSVWWKVLSGSFKYDFIWTRYHEMTQKWHVKNELYSNNKLYLCCNYSADIVCCVTATTLAESTDNNVIMFKFFFQSRLKWRMSLFEEEPLESGFLALRADCNFLFLPPWKNVYLTACNDAHSLVKTRYDYSNKVKMCLSSEFKVRTSHMALILFCNRP